MRYINGERVKNRSKDDQRTKKNGHREWNLGSFLTKRNMKEKTKEMKTTITKMKILYLLAITFLQVFTFY